MRCATAVGQAGTPGLPMACQPLVARRACHAVALTQLGHRPLPALEIGHELEPLVHHIRFHPRHLPLIDRGHAVLFMPTYSLVQELLAAKRNLELPRALRKLDQFAVLILDDVGYIQQSPEEAEILFTLRAERYERRSVFITSNLIFAQWDRIFRDQMATAAAIDRLVHHSVLLEFDVASFRTEHAKRRGKAPPRPATDPTS